MQHYTFTIDKSPINVDFNKQWHSLFALWFITKSYKICFSPFSGQLINKRKATQWIRICMRKWPASPSEGIPFLYKNVMRPWKVSDKKSFWFLACLYKSSLALLIIFEGSFASISVDASQLQSSSKSPAFSNNNRLQFGFWKHAGF